MKRDPCPYCIDALRAANAAYRQRIGFYVRDRLDEVTNDRGAVIGYTLTLNPEQTEKFCLELDR